MTTTQQTETTEPARHPFDRAGLGKPPYRFLGVDEMKFQACQGAPVQAGGSCDYCCAAIMYACKIESSDGKRFKVGCDCVEKVGKDAKDYPSQRALDVAVRAHKNDLRHARENAKIAEGREFVTAHKAELAALPHPNEYWRAKGQTLLDSIEWYFAHAGASGTLKAIAIARKAVQP